MERGLIIVPRRNSVIKIHCECTELVIFKNRSQFRKTWQGLRSVFQKIDFLRNQTLSISARAGLPYGLTERAIAAARQIKFTPATKDGRPVSMYIQLEYNFNLY